MSNDFESLKNDNFIQILLLEYNDELKSQPFINNQEHMRLLELQFLIKK
jgi:hypothetical protein